MEKEKLKQIAQALLQDPKGLLAIDESDGTANKRFKALGVKPTKENRRLYRQLLITAPGIEQFVSGYILYDETMRQKTDAGTLFPDFLQKKGIIPGIKVDMGKEPDVHSKEETTTKGLEGLSARLQEYAQMGAKFTKWRAVIKIDENLPTDHNIQEECEQLARYALIAQNEGFVPVVEPEVLIDGDHTIERCYEVSVKTWKMLIEALKEAGVYLPGCILKASMVVSGNKAMQEASSKQVAEKTIKGLTETIPEEMAGVVFLSGGLSEEKSTLYLNEMHKLEGHLPWPLSFSFARAIQQPALNLFAKGLDQTKKAQEALVFRANMNSLAVQGKYHEDFERQRPY